MSANRKFFQGAIAVLMIGVAAFLFTGALQHLSLVLASDTADSTTDSETTFFVLKDRLDDLPAVLPMSVFHHSGIFLVGFSEADPSSFFYTRFLPSPESLRGPPGLRPVGPEALL